ncbi:HAD family hydrolase [Clostridium neonatale]|uniref:HAD family hydrolase n=1 Tax=Clostridium neonatale TaxID=137838 RepID=UPI003D32BD6F
MIKKNIRKKLDNWASCSPDKIIERLSKYQYVSFDIFDTLIKRDVPTPIDVFSVMEHELEIKNFSCRRILAEKIAREKTKRNEVTLKEIYNNFEGLSGEEKENIRTKEIELEVSLCIENKIMIPIYKYCVKHKKVIFVSDMYLDRDTIIKILNKNGITEYEKLFISNESNKTKADGSLYDYVISDLKIGKNDIIHIGNSYKADYLNAIRAGWHSIKIATYKNRLQKDYKFVSSKYIDDKNYLNTFINNHTLVSNDYYSKFGFECFGPLLFGFIKWLFSEMRKADIEEVFFLARDGYIMKQVYELMGFNKDIPALYFEASRRSLRVPSYSENMSFYDVIKELTVPNMTNLEQIFDSFGLDISSYENIIRDNGFDKEVPIKRDRLVADEKFINLYNCISSDIKDNARKERENLIRYLQQFNFNKKIAIVDIGWGGSMQKYLIQTLHKFGITCDITGFYLGLTYKAKENLGKYNFKAKGYIFDCLNNLNDLERERAFVGLFETLFLEQDGSVKNYEVSDNVVKVCRYPYEYRSDNGLTKEAKYVCKIQRRALDFVAEFNSSVLSKYMINDPELMFSNLYQTGIRPSLIDIKHFGNFEFFNNGSKILLASPQSIFYYLKYPKKLAYDLFDSQWKIGFLKALFKIDAPYLKLFEILRKIAN